MMLGFAVCLGEIGDRQQGILGSEIERPVSYGGRCQAVVAQLVYADFCVFAFRFHYPDYPELASDGKMLPIGNWRGRESVSKQAIAENDFLALSIEAGKRSSVVATVEPVLNQNGVLHLFCRDDWRR
jgi:hypothetical protein